MNENLDRKPKKVIASLVTLILWLLTAVVGLWQFEFIGNMVFRLIAYFIPSGQSRYNTFKIVQAAGALELVMVMILAMVWIAIVIGGAEYHRRRVGKPESWRLFGWTIASQLSILLLALFI